MNIIQSFQGSNFVQFCILKFVIYVNSNTPEAISSVNFHLFGENFVTSFIEPEIKQQTMAKVCGVGLKNLRANFRVEELFSARNVSRYFPV